MTGRLGHRVGDSEPALSPKSAHPHQASPECPAKFSLRLTPSQETQPEEAAHLVDGETEIQSVP